MFKIKSQGLWRLRKTGGAVVFGGGTGVALGVVGRRRRQPNTFRCIDECIGRWTSGASGCKGRDNDPNFGGSQVQGHGLLHENGTAFTCTDDLKFWRGPEMKKSTVPLPTISSLHFLFFSTQHPNTLGCRHPPNHHQRRPSKAPPRLPKK